MNEFLEWNCGISNLLGLLFRGPFLMESTAILTFRESPLGQRPSSTHFPTTPPPTPQQDLCVHTPHLSTPPHGFPNYLYCLEHWNTPVPSLLCRSWWMILVCVETSHILSSATTSPYLSGASCFWTWWTLCAASLTRCVYVIWAYHPTRWNPRSNNELSTTTTITPQHLPNTTPRRHIPWCSLLENKHHAHITYIPDATISPQQQQDVTIP